MNLDIENLIIAARPQQVAIQRPVAYVLKKAFEAGYTETNVEILLILINLSAALQNIDRSIDVILGTAIAYLALRSKLIGRQRSRPGSFLHFSDRRVVVRQHYVAAHRRF